MNSLARVKDRTPRWRWTLVVLVCIRPAAAASDAQAHLGSGLKLFGLERYSEAAREFRLALESDPGLLDARYHLAVCYFNQRQHAEARKQFNFLASSGYASAWVTYYLGRLDLMDGDLDSSIQRFETLRRPEPLQDELYFLGSALLKRGQAEKALGILRRQVQYNRRDFRAYDLLGRAYLKTGQASEAERAFAESQRLRQYYLEGKKELMDCRDQLRAGRTDEAWASCGSVLETDDIDKLVAVGMLFGDSGAHDRALRLFEKALSLDPESPEINFDTGLTYFRKKEYPAARGFLEAALRSRPNFFEALAVFGTILYLTRQDAAAREVLERAHGLRPEDSSVTRLLAEIKGSAPR